PAPAGNPSRQAGGPARPGGDLGPAAGGGGGVRPRHSRAVPEERRPEHGAAAGVPRALPAEPARRACRVGGPLVSGRLQRAVQILLHVEDTPHRTALSFAIGVAIAFSPLLGIHTLLALGIAFLFRLSRGPMLVGAYINNPWTLAPMYMAGTLLGCSIL